MNDLGSEVTVKVKEAIRAKLKEMNANSSDEIIDYIMLLVTTKKSNTELATSINFLMENNTTIFVKWLSTIIKKLQQITVSSTENTSSENPQTSSENTIIDKNDDVLICDATDEKLDISDEEKEELKSDLNVDERVKISNREKVENSLPQLNVPQSLEFIEDKITPLAVELNRKKQNVCSTPTKNLKTINNIEKKKTIISLKNNSETVMNSINKPKKISWNGNEKFDCKTKRPRISINSDDEDDKNVRVKLPITMKETAKPITKDLPKINKKSTSRVIVFKPLESKKNMHETKKKLYMHDLVVQRVDHQRGALALDIAFKYIQQQIGVSDSEIKVIKKWKDYAVDMLRSSKKV